MMRATCEAIGVAMQAIGGALVDASTAPDAREEMRREIATYRAENERRRLEILDLERMIAEDSTAQAAAKNELDAARAEVEALKRGRVEAENKAFESGYEECAEETAKSHWVIPKTAETYAYSLHGLWDGNGHLLTTLGQLFLRLPEPPEVSK